MKKFPEKKDDHLARGGRGVRALVARPLRDNFFCGFPNPTDKIFCYCDWLRKRIVLIVDGNSIYVAHVELKPISCLVDASM